jgi:hypothetical protein
MMESTMAPSGVALGRGGTNPLGAPYQSFKNPQSDSMIFV